MNQIQLLTGLGIGVPAALVLLFLLQKLIRRRAPRDGREGDKLRREHDARLVNDGPLLLLWLAKQVGGLVVVPFLLNMALSAVALISVNVAVIGRVVLFVCVVAYAIHLWRRITHLYWMREALV